MEAGQTDRKSWLLARTMELDRRRTLLLLLTIATGTIRATLAVDPAQADDDDGGGGGGNEHGESGSNYGGDGSGGDDEGSDHDDTDDDDHDDDEKDDHEYARHARQRGTLRPLSDILEDVRRRYGGRVLEVELEHKKNRVWYEIRLLDKHDRVRKVRVPALKKIQNFKTGKR